MRKVVQWSDWQGNGLEHCCFHDEAECLLIEGVIIGTHREVYGLHYLVRTDSSVRTREVRIVHIGGPSLHLTADGQGNWRDMINDRALSSLRGCLDIDIGMTPATNILPIRRLRLGKEESQDVLAAYVPLPDQIKGPFLPTPAKQRYTCLTPGQRYRYEGLCSGFSTELEVDEVGLVRDYPDTFRRRVIT